MTDIEGYIYTRTHKFDRLRIALLTDGIWPFVIGGMQKHSYYLCKYLSQRQIQIALYHTTKTGIVPDLSKWFSQDELQYIESYYIPYPKSDQLPGHYLRTSRTYSKLIYDKLDSVSPVDIIYAKGLTGWEALKQKEKGKTLPPICINVHGYEYYQAFASFKSWLQQLMLRPAFKYINIAADYVYSYGDGITRIIHRNVGRNAGIIEIPTGIEKEFLSKEPANVKNVRTFVFVGRFERRKGVQELSMALKQIKKEEFNFVFFFIGPIPEKHYLPYPECFYLGEISDKYEIKRALEKADILVCPSYSEGMPNVIMEGMACGCAIIASNVGAVPLQVSHNNGWLISPGSSKELYRALKSALQISDEELLSKKHFSLKKVESQFTWETVSEKLIQSFKMILSSDRRDKQRY